MGGILRSIACYASILAVVVFWGKSANGGASSMPSASTLKRKTRELCHERIRLRGSSGLDTAQLVVLA